MNGQGDQMPGVAFLPPGVTRELVTWFRRVSLDDPLARLGPLFDLHLDRIREGGSAEQPSGVGQAADMSGDRLSTAWSDALEELVPLIGTGLALAAFFVETVALGTVDSVAGRSPGALFRGDISGLPLDILGILLAAIASMLAISEVALRVLGLGLEEGKVIGTEEFARTARSVETMRRRLDEIGIQLALGRFTGYSGEQLVSATMTSAGTLVDLRIDPRLLDRRDPNGLSLAVMEAVHHATAQVRSQTDDLMRGLIGVGMARLTQWEDVRESADRIHRHLLEAGDANAR